MVFDWLGGLRRRRTETDDVQRWNVRMEDGNVVAEDGRGSSYNVPTAGARNVRIVPLAAAGNHHATTSGWQVALARPDGDLLVGKPLADWRTARALAKLVCEQTQLPLDELTQRMFSQVGL